jgi:hypothetical protein
LFLVNQIHKKKKIAFLQTIDDSEQRKILTKNQDFEENKENEDPYFVDFSKQAKNIKGMAIILFFL